MIFLSSKSFLQISSTGLFSLLSVFACSQNHNLNWIFGDSSGIGFQNLSMPAPLFTANESRGTCVSYSDSAGNLLLYAYTPSPSLIQIIGNNQFGIIRNYLDQTILNGDTIFGRTWYHEMILLPFPDNDSLFYLFSVGVTSVYGLYYSVINLNGNNGLGEVIQKNIQLSNYPMVDCLAAVKHGNGRDWWLVFRRWYINFLPSNEFFTLLVSPSGIGNINSQAIGTPHHVNSGQLTFSSDGNKLVFTNLPDLIELFEFDRCSGLLNNPVTIHPPVPPGSPIYQYQYTWSSAFSPLGNLLYISTSRDTNYVYQLDLTAANIYSSRLNLDTFYLPPVSPGALKLAPDGKIYFSCAYDNGFNFNYPYTDTMYNYVNMNLSVINYPDSLGTACGYAPFSFYLGGKRTYYGLPNNPDYHLGPKIGSGCDTLTAINEHSQNIVISNLSPNPNNGEFTVDYFLPNGKSGELEVFNITGQRIFYQSLPRYTYMQNIHLKNQAAGIYLLKISGGGKVAVRKFVVSE